MIKTRAALHLNVTAAHLPFALQFTNKQVLNKIKQCCHPVASDRSLSVNGELLSIISGVSLPLGQLVSDRLHTHHTSCKHARAFSLGLMKTLPHPRLSNGPNNGESLGAPRVSAALRDTLVLDRQALGIDTPTLTHANA